MGNSGGRPRLERNLRSGASNVPLLRKSTIYQALTDLPPFVRGDVRGSCLVWGWEQFVGKEMVKIIREIAVNNQHASDSSACATLFRCRTICRPTYSV